MKISVIFRDVGNQFIQSALQTKSGFVYDLMHEQISNNEKYVAMIRKKEQAEEKKRQVSDVPYKLQQKEKRL
jgi:hypothetical protein